MQGSENSFFKKPNLAGFSCFFCLNEHARTICEKNCLESLLVDLRHQLGFYLASTIV